MHRRPVGTGAAPMKTLGLIGGISAESTTVYYQNLTRLVRARLGGLILRSRVGLWVRPAARPPEESERHGQSSLAAPKTRGAVRARSMRRASAMDSCRRSLNDSEAPSRIMPRNSANS